MKKITFILCLSLASTLAFSQNALVKISPFHFLDGTIYATYERALNNNNSFALSGGYRLSDNADEYGWMGELQLRKYIFKPSQKLKSCCTKTKSIVRVLKLHFRL